MRKSLAAGDVRALADGQRAGDVGEPKRLRAVQRAHLDGLVERHLRQLLGRRAAPEADMSREPNEVR